MTKPNIQQVGRAGEYFVAAELIRRGAYAVTFAGNMPEIDILAADAAQTRTVAIQVKTRRSGSWQTRLREWTVRDPEIAARRFWVFVDLARPGVLPAYYIVPERWIQRDIDEHHAAYLARHGGRRARSPGSDHHSIALTRITQWQDRWDQLGIFGSTLQEQAPAQGEPMVGRIGRRELEERGFEGFIPMSRLLDGGLREVPPDPGVYVVLRESEEAPSFRPTNPGGRFKGKDPTVKHHVLESKWVEGAQVIYIGQGARLSRRLRELARFGTGEPVGHWGGRYMWQLRGSEELLVAWLPISERSPRDVELEIVAWFREVHGGSLPFANISG
jgi:hypothetical protein